MTIDTAKLDLEVFARQSTNGSGAPDLDPGALIPIFHRWIQRRELDELAIDVADYRHVPEFSAVFLVCHDGHYSVERRDEQWCLHYSRRRETHPARQDLADLGARLRSVFIDALAACERLETEAGLGGALEFDAGHCVVTVNDRRFGDDDAEELKRGVEGLAGVLFPDLEVGVAVAGGRGGRPSVRLSTPESPRCTAVLERLRATGEGGS